MGLDITHYKISEKSEADSTICIVEGQGQASPLEKFSAHAYIVEQPFVDWSVLFQARALELGDYVEESVIAEPGLDFVTFRFERHPSAPAHLPIFVDFDKPHDGFGDLPIRMVSEQTLDIAEVGYLGGAAVTRDFYNNFEAHEIIVEKSRAEMLGGFIEPGARQRFQDEFLDNWVEGWSFIKVWY